MTSEALRTRREWLGLTQAELAERIGVTTGAVSRWERGERKIPEPVARLVLTFRREGGRETT